MSAWQVELLGVLYLPSTREWGCGCHFTGEETETQRVEGTVVKSPRSRHDQGAGQAVSGYSPGPPPSLQESL